MANPKDQRPAPTAKPKALAKKRRARRQYATLAYRCTPDLEVLLVSSRETGRWVLPKGWPMKGRKPHVAAALEAFEEAGIKGTITKLPVGTYSYDKRLSDGDVLACTVKVFPMAVELELTDWPEQNQRTRQWFSPQSAAEAVEEETLKVLIRQFTPAG
jgi:8-oxo-dGTP pyrophosphatase MutT (NUDIX family)